MKAFDIRMLREADGTVIKRSGLWTVCIHGQQWGLLHHRHTTSAGVVQGWRIVMHPAVTPPEEYVQREVLLRKTGVWNRLYPTRRQLLDALLMALEEDRYKEL